MARHIVDFSAWKRIYEKTDYKVKLSGGEKIKLFKIDQSSFKVKIVSTVDIIGPDGKISPEDWNMLKSQYLMSAPITSDYPALKDLKTNIVIYSVDNGTSEADRAEVITFTIAPRTSAPGVNPALEYIKKEEIGTAVSDPQKATILVKAAQSAAAQPGKEQSTGKEQQAQQTTGAPSPSTKLQRALSFDSVKLVKSENPVFELVKKVYLKLKNDPNFSTLPVMGKLKSELKSGQLGDTSVLFLKGMIAGFGLKDEYDDPSEVLDQSLVDKMNEFIPKPTAQNSSRSYLISKKARLFEQSSSSYPEGFNLEAFVKVVGSEAQAKPTTSDIKLPEGGLKKGVVPAKDPTLIKVQQLLIDKLSPVLGNNAVFKKFVGYGADGRYGPSTANAVKMAKAGFKLSDKDGNTITQELVDALSTRKITESYLTPFGGIYEQFDVAAAEAAVITSSGSSGSEEKSKTSSETSNKPPAPAPTEISQRTVDTALKNKSAAEAYLKILKALMGLTEEEEDVIDAIEDHIQTKQDWIDLETLWGASKFSINRMQGDFYYLGLNSIDDLPKYLKSRLESTDTTSPQLKTLMKALKHYFSDSQMADLAEVLPEGVSIRTEEEKISDSDLPQPQQQPSPRKSYPRI